VFRLQVQALTEGPRFDEGTSVNNTIGDMRSKIGSVFIT
jgi:hypothetical protein